MNIFDKLIELFLKFPGIGPRQAKRFAFFLAAQDDIFLKNLISALSEIKKEVKQCKSCFRFSGTTDTDCKICSDKNRENLVMVVEKDVDLENINKSGVYGGKYFVLGGTLSLSQSNESSLRFKELFEKIKNEKPLEVIVATSATVEGDNTARYIKKILEPLNIKTTRLGRGLSTGTELEYSDDDTIASALSNRK